MKLAAIITCHDSDPGAILACLEGQTRAPDILLLGISGTTPAGDFYPKCKALLMEDAAVKPDFGYSKRRVLAETAAATDADWLAFFCHDDSYHPRYVELMGALAADDADVVWCPWSDRPKAQWRPCDSTLGNFLVRRTAFEAAEGFRAVREGEQVTGPDGTVYTAADQGLVDAMFIKRIRKQTSRVASVPHVLYYHNVPFWDSVKATSWGRPARGGTYAQWLAFTNSQLEATSADPA